MIYFFTDEISASQLKIWQDFRNHSHAFAIRNSLKNAFQHQLLTTQPLIQILVDIAPMLGLFGTVYGMIELFDVIASQGTGDARAMASGISRITLPTMTGMAVAIIGLFFSRTIDSLSKRKIQHLNREMEQNG
ncbi:MAG: MotA/TolQ/ExbB proton channel family protein [Paraglaciecola sp.]|nr:MotA/TolQ/ExbB proton channel family protein [Paraglaciecola sp.]